MAGVIAVTMPVGSDVPAVTVEAGTLSAGSITTNGQVVVSGTGELTVAGTIAVTVPASFAFPAVSVTGGTLSAGSITATGQVLVTGTGSLTVTGVLVASDDDAPAVGVGGGTLSAGSLKLTALGSGPAYFQVGGLTVIHGSSTINGDALLTGGTLRIAAGSVVTVNGSYTQQSSATLQIDVSSGTAYGRLNATGAASIAGTLLVTGVDGYVPARGDSLTFVSGSALTGTFSSVVLPPVDSTLKAVALYSSTGVRVLVTSKADTDNNGVVDVVDLFTYLDAWFAQSGQNGSGLIADYDQNGSVDVVDLFSYLDLWFASND